VALLIRTFVKGLGGSSVQFLQRACLQLLEFSRFSSERDLLKFDCDCLGILSRFKVAQPSLKQLLIIGSQPA